MMYQSEYEQLKREIGYNSPQCTDSLSSGEGDSYDHTNDVDDYQ